MKTIFAIGGASLESFEKAAEAAARCGASHLVATEELPLANWQFDVADDPYPTWFVLQPGLLKIFPPDRIKPFINLDHSRRIIEILKERCAILRRYGLRGAYGATEPQVLPEPVFEAFPSWRGPRVDQVNRSRAARFAPCTNHPEVQSVYAEAMRELIETCPEIDTFLFLTIDSGSGFCWAPALYPGPNGCGCCDETDVGNRAVGFLNVLADAAAEKGSEIEIDLVEIEPRSWMRKAFARPHELAARLRRGLAINHVEGPDGRPFLSRRFGGLFWNIFYPVVGLPRPVDFLRHLIRDGRSGAARAVCNFNDALNNDLNVAVFRAFQAQSVSHESEAPAVLRTVAAELYPGASGGDVVDLWIAVDDAEKQMAALDFGPFLLMGGLLARWITRPFVPFPEQLTVEEKAIFLPHLFQARDEASALNLADIQAMRMFEGWAGRLLVEQAIEATEVHVRRAEALAGSLIRQQVPGVQEVADRLALLRALLRNGRNAVAYQAQLDRLKGQPPEDLLTPPPLGWPGRWELNDLVRIARAEIDNTLEIIRLLERSTVPLLDQAPEGGMESVLALSPNLIGQLHEKVRVMNRHWLDYNRISAPPNP